MIKKEKDQWRHEVICPSLLSRSYQPLTIQTQMLTTLRKHLKTL